MVFTNGGRKRGGKKENLVSDFKVRKGGGEFPKLTGMKVMGEEGGEKKKRVFQRGKPGRGGGGVQKFSIWGGGKREVL